MINIAVHELHKYYGSNHVLKGVTFEIYNGEKVGLLGKNGSGKTTLFKIIADEEPHDNGSVFKATGKKVEILSQIPVFGENDTVEDILRSSFNEVTEIYNAMKKIEGDGNSAVLKRYGKLMEDYERLGGYDVDFKIEKICNGMNIVEEMRRSPFSLLSGGEKTRVNLARILLRDCHILLLDEPTNHLDLTSLQWLENFLREFAGTVVVISHDRVFLDNVISRVIEIENGKLNFYQGNYSYYVAEKEQRLLTQTEQYRQQQKKIHQLEAAAKRMHEWAKQADNKALHKRAFSIEKRIDQMDKVDKPVTSRKMTEDFNSGGYAAKQIVTFENVNKSYGTPLLINLSTVINRNDSIALIGPNGCGKTTLLKLILGEEPDSGIVKVSSNVKIAYMPQIITFENENATVLETLRYAYDLTEEKARAILANFRFKAPDVIKKVSSLSGGEKSRLKLCLLMQNKANFLVLDEPTNHLDIESREWIEDAVSDFDGTMLFISHDRYFLNKFASRIWSMAGGEITDFYGSYDDYMDANTNEKAYVPRAAKKKPAKEQPERASGKSISSINIPYDVLIHETETELAKLNGEIESHLQKSDYKKIDALYQQKHNLEVKLENLYDEWVTANHG